MKARIALRKPACPSCGKETKIQQFRDRYRIDGQEIHHEYLQCEHCGHKSTVAWTDHVIRRLLETQKKAHSETLAASIVAKMNELQAKYESDESKTPLQ